MQLVGKAKGYAPAPAKRVQPCRAAAASFTWPESQRHLMHQRRRYLAGASSDEQMYDLQPLVAWFGRRLRPRGNAPAEQLSSAGAQQLRPIEREAVLQVSSQQGGVGGQGLGGSGINRGADWQRELNEPLLPKRPADPTPVDPNLASSALTNDPSSLRETVDITDIDDRGSGPGRGGYDGGFGGSGGGRDGFGGRGRGDDFNDGGRGGGMSPFSLLLFGVAVALGAWYFLRRSPSEPKPIIRQVAAQEPTTEQIREAVHQKVDDVKHGVADAGEKVKSATERAGEKVKQGLQDTTRKAAESLPPEAREKAEEAAETGRKYWREIGTGLLWIIGIGLLSSVQGPKKDKKKPTYTPTVLSTPAATTVVTPTTTATTTPYRAPIAPPATVPAGVSTAPVTKPAPAPTTVSTATATKPAHTTVSTAAVTKPVIKDADVTAVVTPVRSGTSVKTAPAAASVHTTGMHGADAVMETTAKTKTVTTAGDHPGAHVTRP